MPSPFDQDNTPHELPASEWPTQPEWPAPSAPSAPPAPPAPPTASYPPPSSAPPTGPASPPPPPPARPDTTAWRPAPASPPVWQAQSVGPPTGPPPVPPPPAGPSGPSPRRSRLTSSGSRLGLVLALVIALLVGAAGGSVAARSIFTSAVDAVAPSTTDAVGSGTQGSATTPTNPAPPTTPSQGSGSSSSGTQLSSWDEVVAKVTVGVVNIESRMSGGVGAGTGMVLSEDGEILTNNHVVEGASAIVVTVVSTGESYRATIVGTDPQNDVAVLQLTGASGLATIPLGDSDTVAIGDQVAAIGNAGGDGGEPSVATGRVTALDQQITASDQDGSNAETLTDMIQVDANVVPGDSGGPLANTSGEVIGMDSAASVRAGSLGGTSRSRGGSGTTSGGGEGYAIPINKALSIAEELKQTHANAGGSSGSSSATGSGAFLGVQVQAGSSGGAEIVAVQSGSPAASAGLTAGATIVGVDDTRIADADALVSALADHEPGDQVTITWLDANGVTQRSTATLAG